jgi:hypothetical protein
MRCAAVQGGAFCIRSRGMVINAAMYLQEGCVRRCSLQIHEGDGAKLKEDTSTGETERIDQKYTVVSKKVLGTRSKTERTLLSYLLGGVYRLCVPRVSCEYEHPRPISIPTKLNT